MKFCPDFATNSRKEWRVLLFQSNFRKQIRKLPKILKSVKIIQYHSILFNRVLSCFALLHATPKMAWDAASWGTLREFCSGTPVSLLLFAGGRLPRLLNQSPGPAIRAVWQVFLTCHDTCHMIYCKIQGCRANQIQHCKHNIYMIKNENERDNIARKRDNYWNRCVFVSLSRKINLKIKLSTVNTRRILKRLFKKRLLRARCYHSNDYKTH